MSDWGVVATHFRGAISHERAHVWPCRFLCAKAQEKGLHIQETAWPDGCALMRYAPPQVGSPALIPDKSPAAQITPSFTGSHSGCVGRDSRSLTTHVRQAHFTVAGSRRQKQRPCSAPPAWPSAASCAFRPTSARRWCWDRRA